MRLFPWTLSSTTHLKPNSTLNLNTFLRKQPPLLSPSPIQVQSRPFLSSLLPGGSSSKPPPRTLSASRVLPYPATPCFRAVADVESYSQFLPFITRSVVYKTDEKGYPVSATLTAGYGPTEGSYRSNVKCDEEGLIVTARSGRGIDWGNPERLGRGMADTDAQQQQQQQSEGLFEFLDTVWRFAPVVEEGRCQEDMTRVDLTIEFQLRSVFIATLMNAVEGEVAKMMVEAFAKRMKTLHGQR